MLDTEPAAAGNFSGFIEKRTAQCSGHQPSRGTPPGGTRPTHRSAGLAIGSDIRAAWGVIVESRFLPAEAGTPNVAPDALRWASPPCDYVYSPRPAADDHWDH